MVFNVCGIYEFSARITDASILLYTSSKIQLHTRYKHVKWKFDAKQMKFKKHEQFILGTKRLTFQFWTTLHCFVSFCSQFHKLEQNINVSLVPWTKFLNSRHHFWSPIILMQPLRDNSFSWLLILCQLRNPLQLCWRQ